MVKKIIIVGNKGQDGIIMTSYLENKGYSVIGLNKNNFNILNPNEINKLIKNELPQEIYFFAAKHNSSEASNIFEDNLNDYYNINTDSCLCFLESIKKYSPLTKFFYASSVLIFDTKKEGVIKVNDKFSPTENYSISKVSAMNKIKIFRENGIFCFSGILSNHESEFRKKSFLSKKIISCAVDNHLGEKRKIKVGNLDDVVDWGYAYDFIELIYCLMQQKAPKDYIIATGNMNSIRSFLEITFDYFDLDYRNFVLVDSKKNRRKHNQKIVFDTKPIKKIAPWFPKTGFKDMIHELISSELKSRTLNDI